MGRDYDAWRATFYKTVAPETYYVDFAKTGSFLDADIDADEETRAQAGSKCFMKTTLSEKCVVDSLRLLRGITGTGEDFDGKFLKLLASFPEMIQLIPVLHAVNSDRIPLVDHQDGLVFDQTMSPEKALDFITKSGLADILRKKEINLVDYVFGVEVGLDSNARKNRTGLFTEALVTGLFTERGYNFSCQTNSKKMAKAGLLPQKNFKATKKFDFTIQTASTLWLIELNFYQSPGSKPNETAKSYIELNSEVEALNAGSDLSYDIKFLWITDGAGWDASNDNLRAAFDSIPHLYNLADLRSGHLDALLK